ncbi:hypothetical protein [Planotetraspora kaengkrachanensis]|uniref:hypothetical protein n=1 Tax=Planotetraspora kaengkrachanensis TaxID=575193 RepID=UPI0019440A57|nr:hypothetical protein [Planotetraspora kaengkrachanensis]
MPESRQEDAEEVARETMRRVAANVDMLVDQLSSAKYAFAFPDAVRRTPTAEDLQAVAMAETLIGPLPVALRACLEIVGPVDLCGDGGSLLPHVGYHGPERESWDFAPDPLVLHSGQVLGNQISSVVGDLSLGCACTDPEEDEPCRFHASGFFFSIAPDEAAKENFSGGDHTIHLPNANPDPQLEYVAVAESISLVEYLRLSLAWGGFPGYSVRPAHVPLPGLLERLGHQLMKF